MRYLENKNMNVIDDVAQSFLLFCGSAFMFLYSNIDGLTGILLFIGAALKAYTAYHDARKK